MDMEQLSALALKLKPTDEQLRAKAFKSGYFRNYLCDRHSASYKELSSFKIWAVILWGLVAIYLTVNNYISSIKYHPQYDPGIQWIASIFLINCGLILLFSALPYFSCKALLHSNKIKKAKACCDCLANITLGVRQDDARSKLVDSLWPCICEAMDSDMFNMAIHDDDGLPAILFGTAIFAHVYIDQSKEPDNLDRYILDKQDCYKVVELVEEFFDLVAAEIPGYSLVKRPGWSPALVYREPEVQS